MKKTTKHFANGKKKNSLRKNEKFKLINKQLVRKKAESIWFRFLNK